eukprot:GFUD01089583.1.p1 GENE.GFUD01089583.1~~GFUD01089583.1.p1  ORF type:complete len:172 (-),score=65.71 GFUD01089583.1:54-569(-)
MKLKERLVMAAMGFSLAVVLLVLLDINLVIPHTEHVNSQHGQVKMGGKDSEKHKSRILQKTPNQSEEYKLSKSEEEKSNADTASKESKDDFNDVVQILMKITQKHNRHWKASKAGRPEESNPTIGEVVSVSEAEMSSVWGRFQYSISKEEMYSHKATTITEVVDTMRKEKS